MTCRHYGGTGSYLKMVCPAPPYTLLLYHGASRTIQYQRSTSYEMRAAFFLAEVKVRSSDSQQGLGMTMVETQPRRLSLSYSGPAMGDWYITPAPSFQPTPFAPFLSSSPSTPL